MPFSIQPSSKPSTIYSPLPRAQASTGLSPQSPEYTYIAENLLYRGTAIIKNGKYRDIAVNTARNVHIIHILRSEI